MPYHYSPSSHSVYSVVVDGVAVCVFFLAVHGHRYMYMYLCNSLCVREEEMVHCSSSYLCVCRG